MIHTKGFTIVELIIIIVVIGVLATVATLGFTSYTNNAKNTQREVGVATISDSLETYFLKNGEYPSCDAITSSGDVVSDSVLEGIDPAALVMPNAPEGTSNSIQCGDISTVIENDSIIYVGDGTSECLTNGGCEYYTLRYAKEDGGEIVAVQGRHASSVATLPEPPEEPGEPIADLAATSTCNTESRITWGEVAEATGYTVNQATDSGFTQNLVVTNPSGVTTQTQTGLTTGTEYFYRIKPEGVGSVDWSNVSSVTPTAYGSPTPSVTAFGGTLNLFWTQPTNTNCTSGSYTFTYDIQQATDSGFNFNVMNYTGISHATPNNWAASGLTNGVTYYYRIKSYVNAVDYGWGGTASEVAPGGFPGPGGGGCGGAC